MYDLKLHLGNISSNFGKLSIVLPQETNLEEEPIDIKIDEIIELADQYYDMIIVIGPSYANPIELYSVVSLCDGILINVQLDVTRRNELEKLVIDYKGVDNKIIGVLCSKAITERKRK